MKYISLPIAISFILAGCQSLPNNTNNKNLPDLPVEITSSTATDKVLTIPKTVIVKKSIMPVNYNSVWDRIRHNLTFNVPHNKSVLKHRKRYLRNPYALNKLLKRSEPFIYYIIEELDKHDIPLEIALLPLVESAFDPKAISHANAAGLWQFMPDTGKRFGLQQNWWYDGRKSIVASTQSAISYLKYLHKFFDGDWLLALAAYNSGEGRVQRTMRKNARLNKSTDYWDLDLPKETRDYVPKLLAIIDIIENSAQLRIKLHPIANKQTLQNIELTSQIDLSVASNIAGIPLALFKALNPGFKQWATDPDSAVQVLLPHNKVNSFNQKLILLPEKDRMVWQRYQIKNGDSLGQIAQKFNVDMKSIQRLNNFRGSRIRAGKHLLIPISGNTTNITLPETVQLSSVKNSKPVTRKKMHTIKYGDSLWHISRAYNVSSKDIARWNDISINSTLSLGQTLTIWEKSNTAINNIIYKVKRGDSFARIATKFDVKIEDLEKWNRLTRKNYLQPGQELQVLMN